jgi:hypothetical protein
MGGDEVAATTAEEAKRSTEAGEEKARPPLSGGSGSDSLGDPCSLGVLTVSDRASRGEYEDLGGPAILRFFKEAIKSE